MRKRMYDRHTANKDNVSIPEILSYYGIKFDVGLTPKQMAAQIAIEDLEHATKIFTAKEVQKL